MPYLEVTDVPLYYEVYGAGPDLVMIHGARNNHLVWWQQVPSFSKSYRCTIYDLRGHGLSYPKNNEFNPTVHDQDLMALLDARKIDKATLICHSLGTHIGLSFALQFPERIVSLVLVSGHGGFGTEHSTAYWNRYQKQHGRPPDWRQGFAPTFREREPELAFLCDEIFKFNWPTPKDFQAASGQVNLSLASRIPHFTNPTLFISGANDEPMAPEAIEPLQKQFPNSRLEVIPDAGHYVLFERAKEFNSLVLDFLKSVYVQ